MIVYNITLSHVIYRSFHLKHATIRFALPSKRFRVCQVKTVYCFWKCLVPKLGLKITDTLGRQARGRVNYSSSDDRLADLERSNSTRSTFYQFHSITYTQILTRDNKLPDCISCGRQRSGVRVPNTFRDVTQQRLAKGLYFGGESFRFRPCGRKVKFLLSGQIQAFSIVQSSNHWLETGSRLAINWLLRIKFMGQFRESGPFTHPQCKIYKILVGILSE